MVEKAFGKRLVFAGISLAAAVMAFCLCGACAYGCCLSVGTGDSLSGYCGAILLLLGVLGFLSVGVFMLYVMMMALLGVDY